MKIRHHCIALLLGLLALAACKPQGGKSVGPATDEQDVNVETPSHELSAIDSLMWRQADSAYAMLQEFVVSPEAKELDAFNGHYCQLLLSELLYKNYKPQSNRDELLRAVDYFDSLTASIRTDSQQKRNVFLDARAHYINGAGFYERDSVVEACAEYLKALEVMEGCFVESELVKNKAKFMALTFTHLTELFSDFYLNEQAIFWGKHALEYYQKYDATPWHVAWILVEIGSHYEMKRSYDSAYGYYEKAESTLKDTCSLLYRDILTHKALLDYKTGKESNISSTTLQNLIRNSKSEQEKLSRYLIVGDIFYSEKQYDSACVYLGKVFHNSQIVGAKKQAAEWLVDICETQSRNFEIDEYADFLVPFANLDENNSHVKSQLAKLCSEYELSSHNRNFHNQGDKTFRTIVFIGGVVLVVLIGSLSFLLLVRKKLKAEPTKKPKPDISVNSAEAGPFCFAASYAEEPVCRHILDVCNDKRNPIKSTVPYSAYSGISLDDTQLAQLKNAAHHHFNILFDRLEKEHPELKDKDYHYCYLCLLGVDNVQIAALLQKSNSTIWDREKRLQKILGCNEKIAITLHRMIVGS